MRDDIDDDLASTGSYSWWQRVRGRCIQRGAGVTGTVLLDGIAFRLGDHTPVPTTPLNPGAAVAAWYQTDNDGFTGYEMSEKGSVW